MDWTEARTAYQVGRLGTVSAAADFLGVHRATVTRHIDTLEAALGAKLFQRHTKGYVPTELGLSLMRIAETTEEQFNQFMGSVKGHSEELVGDFVITSLDAVAHILMPLLSAFQRQNPELIMRYLSSRRLLRLEYGEAHCAMRLGAKPDQPDQVVQLFDKLEMGLYASCSYAEKHGLPRTPADYPKHFFLDLEGPADSPACHVWLRNHIPPTSILFRSNSPNVLGHALLGGLGIGFAPRDRASQEPNLIELHYDPDWAVPIWLVTHVDLHRSFKVQAFVKFLKNAGYLSSGEDEAQGPCRPEIDSP